MPFLNSALAQTGTGMTQAAHGAWHLFTRLGEAQVLLPAMLVTLLWLIVSARATPAVLAWLLATGAAIAFTTATKVAFFGYEIGYAPLDYTGISGHAMFAAAVLPVLFALAAGGASPRTRRMVVAAGYVLAAMIAYSRLPVGAHSPIEALAGLALGSLASSWVVFGKRLPDIRPPLWLGAVLLLWMLSLPVGGPPSPTHGWVIRLSMAVADRPAPYQRWQMHRDYRREKQRRQAAQASNSAKAPAGLR